MMACCSPTLNLATSETLRWSRDRDGANSVLETSLFSLMLSEEKKKRSKTVFPIKFAAGNASCVVSRFKRMGMIKHSWTAGSDI